MTLRWLPIDRLEPHPENANRMSADRLEKLKGHIVRTGRYEPIVVRPIPVRSAECGVRSKRQKGENGARYQILNGHHRARVLRELGRKRARCDVWDVDDDEARMLLATLNRLEGRDDPKARARLVAHLATGRSAEDLARLLPEPPDAVERLLRLAEPPPEPAPPDSLEPLPEALVFFLNAEQHALVSEALRAVGETPLRIVDCGLRIERQAANERGFAARLGGRCADRRTANGSARSCSSRPRKRAETFEARPVARGDSSRLGRAERLERLALWYLESVGRR